MQNKDIVSDNLPANETIPVIDVVTNTEQSFVTSC